MRMTTKQESYLLSLVNKVHGTSYRYLSQVNEDGIGRRAKKVRGIKKEEASQLIDEYKERLEEMEDA